MLDLIRRYSKLYLIEILRFTLMGNHFNILVRMFPDYKFTDEDIKKRYEAFYGDKRLLTDGQIPVLREKLSNLSEFVREIITIEFVSANYKRFRELFMSKREKAPKPIVGLDGIYSLKRLGE